MQRLSWIFTLPFVLFLVVFSLSNRHSFSLSLFPFEKSLHAPAFLWLFLFFLCGFFIGGFFVQVARLKDKKTIHSLKKSHNRLNKDVEKLNDQTRRLKKDLAEAKQNSIENPYFLNDNPDITPLIPKKSYPKQDS